MNLYKVSQTENNDYDTYDAMIVAATTEDVARNTHPFPPDWGHAMSTWCSTPDKATVELIGTTTNPYYDGEIVLASYNAG